MINAIQRAFNRAVETHKINRSRDLVEAYEEELAQIGVPIDHPMAWNYAVAAMPGYFGLMKPPRDKKKAQKLKKEKSA